MSHYSDSSDLMEELTQQFIEEVGFMLEECEESLLKLHHLELRDEELAKIFRVAHSVKGSAIALELTDLSSFGHVVEDCLATLRTYPDQLSPEIVSMLLKANDAFKKYLEKLKAKSDAIWDVAELKQSFITLNRTIMDRTSPAMRAAQGMVSIPPLGVAVPGGGVDLPEESAPESADSTAPSQAAIKVKVDAVRLDTVLDLVGELVVIKSQILQAFQEITANNLKESALLALFDKTVRDLQDRTLTMRMTSIRPIFLRAERIVRDLSRSLGKSVRVVTSGSDIEIDRSMIEMLVDPMVHLMRNSMDHGIESAEVRSAAGKPEEATITLAARQAGGRIILEIRDDGAGISRERVFKRAQERNLVAEGQQLDQLADREIHELLFTPGFSTAEKVTDVSGRGVGLDVVRSNVEKMKGAINVESSFGAGTTFRISLPLTTAITDGIVVLVEGLRVVIPIDHIREIVEIGAEQLVRVHTGVNVVNVRGSLLPIVDINEAFGKEIGNFGKAPNSAVPLARPSLKRRDKQTVMLLRGLDFNFALVIEGVIGQSQVVVKPLGSSFRTGNGLSGAAVLGDGKVALVLDVDGLVKIMKDHFSHFSQEEQGERIA